MWLGFGPVRAHRSISRSPGWPLCGANGARWVQAVPLPEETTRSPRPYFRTCRDPAVQVKRRASFVSLGHSRWDTIVKSFVFDVGASTRTALPQVCSGRCLVRAWHPSVGWCCLIQSCPCKTTWHGRLGEDVPVPIQTTGKPTEYPLGFRLPHTMPCLRKPRVALYSVPGRNNDDPSRVLVLAWYAVCPGNSDFPSTHTMYQGDPSSGD